MIDIVGVLDELINLMQDAIDGEYKPDGFTLQPARKALSALRSGEVVVVPSKYLENLSELVEQHRHDVVITCDKDCWCWGVDAFLYNIISGRHEDDNT